MPDAIQYLAVVQLGGLMPEDDNIWDGTPEQQKRDDNPVESRGFATHVDAVRWVRDQVENAHGELALVVPHLTKLTYDFGGQPVRLTRWLWSVITSGGPTWGMVIDVSEISDEETPDAKA